MDKIFEDFKNQIMDKYLAIETENNELKKQNQELTTDKLLTENVVEHLHATIDERDDRIQSLVDEIKELEQEVEQLKQEKQNVLILKAQEKMAEKLQAKEVEKDITIQQLAKKIGYSPQWLYSWLVVYKYLKRVTYLDKNRYYEPIGNAKYCQWLILKKGSNGRSERIYVTPKGQRYFLQKLAPEKMNIQNTLMIKEVNND